MNAVEIEEAVSALAERPFDGAEFPYQFLEAFGNKEATIKRLRAGATNKSDLGGVLQTNNIHIAVASPGEVTKTLAALKASPGTTKAKAKFVLATDGDTLEAEDIISGDPIACAYKDFPNHFAVFLPLAGISTFSHVTDSSIDIRATSHLNKLYVELLKENQDWDTAARRPDMNHFMARLIFCFFAEDTDIFNGTSLFTSTVERMSARDSFDTHEVIGELFRSMNTREEDKELANIRNWARPLPYVNGGLFSGSVDVPRFSKIARAYLIRVGSLDWRKINPDIFGSMIQAIADDEERGALGMHYTSVPNILKVLNPLFLDDLRTKLDEASDNSRKLLNLRNRMARIRVFDPACGSGNFLVIAYKEMREIEADINKKRNEVSRKSDIPLTNFRGIELRNFPAEIARLALIIAEFQCDVLYRGKKLALAEFLPLDAENWITCGNALRLDWLALMDVGRAGVRIVADTLQDIPANQAEIEFENEGGETYICGNPPYLGNKLQSDEQKSDLKSIFEGRTTSWKSLDYVSGWFMKAADFGIHTTASAALVTTNSICQGQQVPILWPLIFETGHEIAFAHASFRWSNLASYNAGVTVAIVGISNHAGRARYLYSISDDGSTVSKEVDYINAYLAPARNLIVEAVSTPNNGLAPMMFGNMPRDGGHLLMSVEGRRQLLVQNYAAEPYLKDFVGSEDAIYGTKRVCVWVSSDQYEAAQLIPELQARFVSVQVERQAMKATSTQSFAKKSYRFVQIQGVSQNHSFIVPRHSSESRPYLPVALYDASTIVADSAFAIYDAPLWNFAVVVSRLHLVWIAAVCGKLETRYRYSNTLGWNTFPLPNTGLTDKMKVDLTRCAEDIILARENHFPATIAGLYSRDAMPDDLRQAHERNDEVLERAYMGRRFKNDTERLEKLFELYTKVVAKTGAVKKRKAGAGA